MGIQYQKEINFGHVIWGGNVFGESSIIIGNIGGNKEIKLLTLKKEKPLSFREEIIDEDVGPTQISVIGGENYCKVLSANHGVGEVVLYEVYK